MNPVGPYLLEGVSYGREELLAHCRDTLGSDSLPDWKEEVYSFILQFLDRSADRIIQHSSGTTGEPKPIYLRKEAMVNSARRTLEFFRPGAGSRILLCLPVRYIAGKMVVVRALEGKLDLVLAEPSGNPLHSVSGPFSLCSLVPLQLHSALEQGEDLSRFETILVGGGSVHETIREKLALVVGTHVYESFAMTETCSHIALKRISGPVSESFFTLMQGVRISTDQRGCLVAEMEGVTEQPVITNDLVEIRMNGRQFSWEGRYDNLINSGGIKIRPEPLEQEIGKWLGYECVLVAVTDPVLGERMVLVVEHPGDGAPVDRWEVLLKSNLAAAECPKRIVTLERFPRNLSFKPDRKEIKRMLNLF